MVEDVKTEAKHATNMERENSTFYNFQKLLFVCIEYPGFVNNVDKALENFKGEANISHCHRQNARIPFTFRPKDQFSHPMYSNASDSRNILVRIKRRRKKTKMKGTENFNPWIYSTECLGIIHKTYRFDSLMDYQFLAPKVLQDSFRSMRSSELFTDNQPMFLPPSVFSRSEQCGPYNYTPNPFIKDSSSKVGPVRKKYGERFGDTEVRQSRPNLSCLFYNTDDPIPTEPKKELTDSMAQSFTVHQMDTHAELTEMFKNRPMWSKTAAMFETNSTSICNFNPVLSCVAYYWMKGPWRTMWCRFGYDPRKDPEAKNYQPVEWRPRQSHGNKASSQFVLNLWKKFNEKSKGKHPKKSDNAAPPYLFDGLSIPDNLQGTIQLCDINMPEVKKILEDKKYQLDKYDKLLGWMTSNASKEIRSIVAKKCFQLLQMQENQNTPSGSDSNLEYLSNESYVQNTVDEIMNSTEDDVNENYNDDNLNDEGEEYD